MPRSAILASVRIIGATVLTTAILAGCSATAPNAYGDYQAPRNSFGQPDLSGFWTNASLTGITRPKELGDRLVHTEEEVAVIEGRAETMKEEGARATDPNAPAEFRHETTVTRAEYEAAGGDVGGYNHFWLEPGARVMRVNGEPRTSVLTTKDGQIPARKKDAAPFRRSFGAAARDYVGYETRSLGERCIIGFGRNGGPPMFANGFYNNNYQFVQGRDHVMILVEMNHDARIVRLNSEHRTDDVRPWFGDSIGWWEDDTLVVETTHIPQAQALYGSWENLKVTERFTRVAADRMHYAFTIDDPSTWDKPWGGEYEFSPLDGEIFEYACHEGNYALPGILGGLLSDAKKAAKK